MLEDKIIFRRHANSQNYNMIIILTKCMGSMTLIQIIKRCICLSLVMYSIILFLELILLYMSSFMCFFVFFVLVFTNIHNILQIHNNDLWDWQYSMEYSHILLTFIFECCYAWPSKALLTLGRCPSSQKEEDIHDLYGSQADSSQRHWAPNLRPHYWERELS